MSKKLWTLLSLLVIAAMLLGACAKKTETPTQEAVPPTPTQPPAAQPTDTPEPKMGYEGPSEPTTIAFWEQEGDEVDVFIDGLIADFQAKYPNVTVERTHYANEDLRDQFQTASLAEAAPEVVRVPNDFAGPFSALDIVAPVDQLFDAEFLSQFFDGALGPAKVGGILWGVPDNYGNHLMLLYNKDLIAEPPATFEDLIAKAKELTSGDIQGFAYNLNEPFWGAGFYGAFGGWPLDDKDQPQFDNPAFVNYLTFVKSLKDDGVVPQECDYGCADTLFKEGKAAMIINGDWSLGDYKTALGDKLGTAPVPPINGKPYTEMTAGKYWMVSKAVLADANKKAAVQAFIAYMTSADVQKKWLDEQNRLPSNKEIAKDPKIASDPVLAGSMAALANGRGMPAAPQMRCAWDAWRPNLEGVMAGTIKPEDAAKAAQAAANECVATLGQPEPTAEPPAQGFVPIPVDKPVTITIWHQWDGKYLEAIQAAFDEYTKLSPNVTIDLSKPDDVANALNTAIPAGEGPDIIGWANDKIGEQALAGNIVDLSTLGITMDFLKANYEPAAVNGVVWSDMIWALPESQEGIALVYNKDLVTAEYLPTDPMNFDDLLAKAEKFYADKGIPLICNQAFGGSDAYHMAPIYFGFGVPSYVDEDGKVYVNTPEMIAAGEWLAKLAKVSLAENSYDICKANLKEGKVGMWWTGPWAIAGIEEDGVNYGILAFGRPFVGIKTLMISKNAVDRGTAEIALDIIKFFTNAEMQKKVALVNKTIPANSAALADPEIAALPTLAGFGASLNLGIPMSSSPYAGAQWGPVGDASKAIWVGAQTPAEAFAAAQKAIEDAIAQMK